MANINLNLKKESFVPKFFPLLFDYSRRWEVYMGSQDAAKELNIDGSSIRKCCKGQLKTAGGYHWCYKTGGDTIASD